MHGNLTSAVERPSPKAERFAYDVILCYPLFNEVYFTEPVGVCLLAAYLKARGFQVEVDDGFLRGESYPTVTTRMLRQNPLAVGLSINAEREVHDALKLARALRNAGFLGAIVAGGAFASMEQVSLIQSGLVDYVVVGDGEEATAELLWALRYGEAPVEIPGIANQSRLPAVKRTAIMNLDSIPLMDREIFRRMIQQNGNSLAGIQATISTGRGCFADCTFCSIQTFAKMNKGAKYRERTIKGIVAEMHALYGEFGIRDFYFCSGQFLHPKRTIARTRCAQLREEIARLPFQPSIFLYIRCDDVEASIVEDLRASGVTTIFLGVESFDDPTLLNLCKGLTSADIIRGLELLEAQGYGADYRSPLRLKLGFIMFTPWTDLVGLTRNLHFCRQFHIPPKKMLYSLQIHPDNRFPDGSFQIVQRENVHFVDLDSEIGDVYRAYSSFFGRMFWPLEKMRAFQKADLTLPKYLEAASYAVVDTLNDLAYITFGHILAAAAGGKAIAVGEQAQQRVVEVLERTQFKHLVRLLDEATAASRVKCPESYLNRGLDNPQVLDPRSVEPGIRYP